ncbi:uncharacterized protein [Mycetomoellerius zeteki]|uniref:uncharacterized protein n=1 Tax=Mycetomoellerius zeteki TaxID=64791 RepID=UPI00084E9FB7|nr:PREDICTED: uncharacterized protein LOC108721834 [Trachymyrmex zeteki]
MTDATIRRNAAKLQRQLALRMIRGYRMISHETALLLARMVLFDLTADRLRRSYLRRRACLRQHGFVAPKIMDRIREEEIKRSIDRWRNRYEKLPRGAPGAAVREALVGRLHEWMARAHGGLTFRMTQVITGHGCFEVYLSEINKAETPICQHCMAARDNAVHTLLHLWAVERRNLFVALGLDLYLDREYTRAIGAIVGSASAWTAFANYCEIVIRRKEEAEREHKGVRRIRKELRPDPPPPPPGSSD